MALDDFDKALEAVFGDRAREVSGNTRLTLKQLWREGVKHGRAVEANSGPAHPPNLGPKVASPKLPLMDTDILDRLTRQQEARNRVMESPFLITSVAAESPGRDITLEDIKKTLTEFREKHGLPDGVPGSYIPESFGGSPLPLEVKTPEFHVTTTPTFRQELFGRWNDHVAPTTKDSVNSYVQAVHDMITIDPLPLPTKAIKITKF